jgi:flagellar motor switch protein FliG
MSTSVAVTREVGDQLAELTGRQKVAILLMAVGEEASAEITRNLSADEVEAISFQIARMDKIDPAVVEAVIDEWHHTEQAVFSLAQGGVDYARRVLEKAFEPTKAAQVLRRIEAQLHDTVSLTHLRSADPQQLGAIIQYEHPQIMAVVLTYLDSAQTAAVIREIDTMQGSDVLMRMARMKKVMPDVLRIIEASLGTDSDLSLKGEGMAAGGPGAVAEVLNLMSAATEKELLDGLAERDPDLSDEIRDLMFVFEDIVTLDPKGVTRLLRDVDTRELALALKLASDELKERILSTLSSRARDSLLEEMEFLGPQRVSDVEAAQANIVKLARALEEAGELVIGASDDMVVE